VISLDALARVADDAGAKILEIYHGAHEVSYKGDSSPLTAADLAAHSSIKAALERLTPEIAQLSEEGKHLPFAERASWRRYWLIDPLDGTKEFIRRNGEFTVNIALIEDGVPVQSVVYAPVSGEMLLAQVGTGVWRREGEQLSRVIAPTRDPQAPLRIAASRSHADPRLSAWLENVGPHTLKAAGSSLKFMQIATGAIDVYPRFGLTSEWDTAAGQLLVEESGGRVVGANQQPLSYGRRDSLLNPDFCALANGIDLAFP